MGTAFRISGSDASNPIIDCESWVEVGDYVYINESNVADLADASSENTMPCIGYVVKKPEATKAVISSFYIENDLEEIVNRHYYHISDSVAGAIQEDAPVGKGTVSQVVAHGIGTTSIFINIDPDSAVINSK